MLNALKKVPEVGQIFYATVNAAEVVVAETALGRASLGVVDGAPPKGIEREDDVMWRHQFLRKIGYKLAPPET